MPDQIQQELTFEELALIAGGHSAFQLLWAGIRLRVFDILSKKTNCSKMGIQQETKLDNRPLEILLSGLSTLRLIRQENGLYRNAKIVEDLLLSKSHHGLSEVLGWQNYIVYPGEMAFLESLQKNKNIGLKYFPGKGKTIYERLANNPKLEKIFQNAMTALTGSANSILAKSNSFEGCHHLLDVGGGEGTNAIKIAEQNTNLKITVFDLPTICRKAKKKITEIKLEKQIRTHPGDFIKEPFPKDVDCVLFAHLLTIWSPERNIMILTKAYNVLPKGGKVFIFNMMSNDDGVGPMTAALGSPYFQSVATGEGKIYSKREIREFLNNSGFFKIDEKSLPVDHRLLIAEK